MTVKRQRYARVIPSTADKRVDKMHLMRISSGMFVNSRLLVKRIDSWQYYSITSIGMEELALIILPFSVVNSVGKRNTYLRLCFVVI